MHDQVADLVQKGRLLPPEERERLVDHALAVAGHAAFGHVRAKDGGLGDAAGGDVELEEGGVHRVGRL